MKAPHFPLACLAILSVFPVPAGAEPSQLWGRDGSLWKPASRLPDFSFAGYRCGEAPVPEPPVTASVKAFGAAGDGRTDDTAAIRKALASTERGVVFLPAGRYLVNEPIEIAKGKIVLRGAGMGRTVLVVPRSLTQVFGAKTSDGTKSAWAFGGGFIEVKGKDEGTRLSDVMVPAKRGDRKLTLRDASAIAPGSWVRLLMNDAPSLGRHVHGDLQDASETTRKELKHFCDWVARVGAKSGNVILLDRPLRLDVRPDWQPEIWSWKPTVQDVGIESLSFEFPGVPKKPHLSEEGFNAIQFHGVANSWVRNVEVIDADNGVILGGSRFCVVDGFHARAAKRKATWGKGASADTGHHAMWASGHSQDCLFTRFVLETTYVHDLTVEGGACGNVFEAGKGVSIDLDHHSNAPYENLFTDIEVGNPWRLWHCGGRADRGPHTGARTTIWNLRGRPGSKAPAVPDWPQINVIGLNGSTASKTENREWIEPCSGNVTPPNLFRAQLARRLASQGAVR